MDPRWGKAQDVAVAEVEDGAIKTWTIHHVDWATSHDEGTHGSHHARIVRFLRANDVEAVVIDHAGPPMINTMQKMGLAIATGARGPARDAVLQASALFADHD